MIDSNPDTLAVVEYHLWDGYELPWGANRGQVFYANIFQGTPCFVLDGLWDAWPISTYVTKFNAQQAVPTTVTMSVGAEAVGGDTYEVTIRTCLEPGAPSVALRIYAVGVEDRYPSTPNYSRNTFRVATSTSDISLSAGECDVQVRNITIAPLVSDKGLKIIVWAQEPFSSWPADVYQSAKELWPFSMLPATGDYDNDGDVDMDDYLEFPGCMSGPDPAVPPSPECLSAFDSDSDDDVDLEDFQAFTLSYTG